MQHSDMPSCFPTQLVLFVNDAVNVTFSDGSMLQLSPCGSSFTHHEPPHADYHPLHGQRSIQQRTQYVTSAFKEKVIQALEFRNRFCQRPYICGEIGHAGNILRLHTDITEVVWPKKLSEAAGLEVLPDGSTCLTSVDEFARIILAPHGEFFTVVFLAHVSQKAGQKTGTASRHETTESLASRLQKLSTNESIMNQTPANASDMLFSPIVSPRKSGVQRLFDNSALTVSELNESQLVSSSPLSDRKRSKTQKPDISKDGKIPTLDFGDDSEQTNKSRTVMQGLDPSDGGPSMGEPSAFGDGKWDFVWLSQNFSVRHCPENWQHPIQLLVDRLKEMREDAASDGKNEQPLQRTDQILIKSPHRKRDKTKSAEVKYVVSQLPLSLPLNCTAQHLHKWKPVTAPSDPSDDLPAYCQGRVKIICSQGIIYRLLWESPRAVEILPGDGSVMYSTSLSGHFFQHMFVKDGQLDERTYSSETPPPTPPGAKYSIEGLLSRTSRFLEWLRQDNQQLLRSEPDCCWLAKPAPVPKTEPPQTELLEECSVPDQGRFSAFTNGRVRVVFNDRTCLDMWYDFSHRLAACLHHGQGDAHDNIHSSGRHCVTSGRPPPDLPQGIARLLLPNGHYHTVSIEKPGDYQRYVELAVQWGSWVNCLPSERYKFYKDTIHDPEKQKSIEQELKKINCFGYIMDNLVLQSTSDAGTNQIFTQREQKTHSLPHHGTLSSGQGHLDQQTTLNSWPDSSEMNLAAVQQILQRTSQAVRDLDNFIDASKQMKK